MDWQTFCSLMYLLSHVYFIIFCFSDGIANMLKALGREEIRWRVISVYRFLRPVRYLMCVVHTATISFALTWNASWVNYLTAAIYAIVVLFDKDRHGDDPRDKKPSKVSSLIKSLGHRLVIVPAKV